MSEGIFYQTSINLKNNLSTNLDNGGFSINKESNNPFNKFAKDNLLQKYTENKRINKYQLQILFPYHLFNKFSMKTDEELNNAKLDLSRTITNDCKVLDKERTLLNSIWENDYQKYLQKTENLLKFRQKIRKQRKPTAVNKLCKEPKECNKENNLIIKIKSSKDINKKNKIKIKPLCSMKNFQNLKRNTNINNNKINNVSHTTKSLMDHKNNKTSYNEGSNHLFSSNGSKHKKRIFKSIFNNFSNEASKINNDFHERKTSYKQSWIQNKFFSPNKKTIYNNYLLFNKQQHSRLNTNVNTMTNKMLLKKLKLKMHNNNYKI